MPFDALPGIWDIRSDGFLNVAPINDNPVICVIGTAASGPSRSLYVVNRVADAARAFGRTGTLTRGLFEVVGGGGANLRLFRVGATAATLENVGVGITITTVAADFSAGTDYKLFWDDSEDRLRVYRVSDDTLVYDNNPVYPSLAVDLGEVSVSGTASGAPGDIGQELGVGDGPITLAAADGVSGAVYTAGSDGVQGGDPGAGAGLSRMRLWEELYDAYQLLENEALDIIVPMDVYLDDLSVQDLTAAQIVTRNLAALADYPTAGADDDVLGLVFVQEFEGTNYYWWDTDADGVAEIFPTVGSATATTDALGNTIAAADYGEANFAYQLARFCFQQSQDSTEMIGCIGTRPPASLSGGDVSTWTGNLPEHEIDQDTGDDVITTNGTGLLGNKWMTGRLGGGGLDGFSVDGLDGRFGGGLIATDSEFPVPHGAEQTDRNDQLVDLGKYISVVGAQVLLSNSFQTTSYIASFAPTYAGFVSKLVPNSAPTNKVVPGVRLPFRVKNSKLDDLAGAGFVMLRAVPKGVVVADAPTAARYTSDWRRLSTIRIVKATLDALRVAADPFLGESLSGARLAALDTTVDRVLGKLVKAGFLQRYDHKLLSTPTEQVQGRARLELKLVPAFELRALTVYVSLAAS